MDDDGSWKECGKHKWEEASACSSQQLHPLLLLSIQTELLPEAGHPLKDSECLQHALALPTGALLWSEQWIKQ